MQKKVVVIGGGPAGLFAARTLALRHPTWLIAVYDRLDIDGTLGFGVGLTGAALERIAAVDPGTRRVIDARSIRFSEAQFRLPGRTVRFPGFHRGLSISRPELRRVLADQAVKAGVEVVVNRAVDVDDVPGSADLIIAADGVSSQTRLRYGSEFGEAVSEGRGVYLWCGAETELPGTIFAPVVTEYGVFTAHAYPYGPGRSTLVVETTDETLRNAGLGSSLPSDANDEKSMKFLSQAFKDLLSGTPLRGNRSQWFHFRTVTCKTWVHRHIVLLGDAAATADPSLGSGTKLAMESAIALANALDGLPDKSIEECLQTFDSAQRPAVEAFQDLAVRSQRWWDTFPLRMSLQGERLAVAFLTRAGAVTLDDALVDSAELILPAVASWAQVASTELPEHGMSAWVVGRPLDVGPVRATSRILSREELSAAFDRGLPEGIVVTTDDPWGEIGTEVVAHARRVVADGAICVLLTGGVDRHAILNRIQVAERVRLELGCPVGVDAGPAYIDDVAAGLVAGRIDFACELNGIEPSSPSDSTPSDSLAGRR